MGSGHDQRAGLPVSRYVRPPLGTRVHICLLLRKDRRHDPIIRIPSALDVVSRNAAVLPASDTGFLNGGSNGSSRRIYPPGLAALLLRLSTWTNGSGGCIPLDLLGFWRHEPRNDYRALPAGRVDPCGLYLANSHFRPESTVRLVAGVCDNRGLPRTRCASPGLNQSPQTRFAGSGVRFWLLGAAGISHLPAALALEPRRDFLEKIVIGEPNFLHRFSTSRQATRVTQHVLNA